MILALEHSDNSRQEFRNVGIEARKPYVVATGCGVVASVEDGFNRRLFVASSRRDEARVVYRRAVTLSEQAVE